MRKPKKIDTIASLRREIVNLRLCLFLSHTAARLSDGRLVASIVIHRGKRWVWLRQHDWRGASKVLGRPREGVERLEKRLLTVGWQALPDAYNSATALDA